MAVDQRGFLFHRRECVNGGGTHASTTHAEQVPQANTAPQQHQPEPPQAPPPFSHVSVPPKMMVPVVFRVVPVMSQPAVPSPTVVPPTPISYCSMCGFQARSEGEIVSHERMHTLQAIRETMTTTTPMKPKTLSCEHCSYQTDQKGQLNRYACMVNSKLVEIVFTNTHTLEQYAFWHCMAVEPRHTHIRPLQTHGLHTDPTLTFLIFIVPNLLKAHAGTYRSEGLSVRPVRIPSEAPAQPHKTSTVARWRATLPMQRVQLPCHQKQRPHKAYASPHWRHALQVRAVRLSGQQTVDTDQAHAAARGAVTEDR